MPEVINGANQDLVRGFYEKWYQPENISIIAVGDFDTNQVENYIHKYFNYNGSRKGETPKEYSLNNLKNKYITFSDDEIRYNTFTITKILDRAVIKDEESMKKLLLTSCFLILSTLDLLIYKN